VLSPVKLQLHPRPTSQPQRQVNELLADLPLLKMHQPAQALPVRVVTVQAATKQVRSSSAHALHLVSQIARDAVSQLRQHNGSAAFFSFSTDISPIAFRDRGAGADRNRTRDTEPRKLRPNFCLFRTKF